MANVCSPTAFPDVPYFEQHELAEFGPPGYTYQHTRGLRIRTTQDPFSAEMVDSVFALGSNYPGLPYDPAVPSTRWEEVVETLFAMPGVPPTSFDFTLWFRSRIGIFMEDGFWWFSTKLAPITMKHRYGAHYFDLRLHHVDGGSLASLTLDQWRQTRPNERCRCISFFAQDPCRDPRLDPLLPQIWHGFSLNLELYSPGMAPLPITIDPDVENKGGNPGP
jgi:hypothetical protein